MRVTPYMAIIAKSKPVIDIKSEFGEVRPFLNMMRLKPPAVPAVSTPVRISVKYSLAPYWITRRHPLSLIIEADKDRAKVTSNNDSAFTS